MPVAAHPASAVAPCRRRAWLAASGGLLLAVAGLAGCAAGGRRLFSGQAPWPVLSGLQAYRLVNRLTWGASDAELARLDALGPAAYVQAQLAPEGDDALPAEVQQQIAALRISRQAPPALVTELTAQSRRAAAESVEADRLAAQQAYQRALNQLTRETAARHLWRAVHGRHQLREQMTWFWANHFSVFQYKGMLRAMVADYEEQAIRPHALGRFRTLLGAVVRHPAMLVYLDNAQNAANRPNENLARELLELHTLGVDGGYSQADVQALARVLTGHGTNFGADAPRVRPEWQALHRREPSGYEFNPARHDFGDKRLLGQPVTGQGADQLDQVLDRLAAHPATARHVSRKIARFMLGDDAPPALLAQMAAAYLRHDGDIAQVLQVLVAAPEFVGPAPRCLKDPMHFVVSAVRAAYGPGQPVLNTQPLQGWLTRLGQALYNRSTPDGWPLDADAWTGSGQLALRFEVARALGGGNAGLFKPDDSVPVPLAERPGFPQLARPLYYQRIEPQLAANTRQALASAASPQDWNALLLASPEFLQR